MSTGTNYWMWHRTSVSTLGNLHTLPKHLEVLIKAHPTNGLTTKRVGHYRNVANPSDQVEPILSILIAHATNYTILAEKDNFVAYIYVQSPMQTIRTQIRLLETVLCR